jgi:cation diffusion facilitator CzcD-associated flavoprotein CzcO
VPEQQTLRVHQSPKRVAVIGAGTSGLSFLKVVKDYKRGYDLDWDVVLFEKRHDVGGIW